MSNSTRLIYFDYFRGIAILLVVASHSFGHWEIDEKWEFAIAGLISGATALFVFISGFFFQYIFIEKFKYNKFIFKKTKAVLVPYLILSILYLSYLILSKGSLKNVYTFENFEMNNFTIAIMNLFTGNIIVAYWYIPFVMIIFLLSPIFIKFAKSSIYLMISITLIFFLIAGVVHRSDNGIVKNINLFQNLIYFTGYYLFGILYAKYRNKFDNILIKYRYIFYFLFFLIVLLASQENLVANQYKENWFEMTRFDYSIPIKILSILLILIFTKYISKYDIKFLSYLAKISFGLFFVHGVILSLFYKFKFDSLALFHTTFITDFFLTFSMVLIFTTLMVESIKLVFRKKSIFLVGY